VEEVVGLSRDLEEEEGVDGVDEFKVVEESASPPFGSEST